MSFYMTSEIASSSPASTTDPTVRVPGGSYLRADGDPAQWRSASTNVTVFAQQDGGVEMQVSFGGSGILSVVEAGEVGNLAAFLAQVAATAVSAENHCTAIG